MARSPSDARYYTVRDTLPEMDMIKYWKLKWEKGEERRGSDHLSYVNY